MYDELERKAKKKVDDKVGFFITAVVFGFISIILAVIWLFTGASMWVLFPILVLALILGITYVSMFGIPGTGTFGTEWQEEEIEREMARMYYRRRKYLPPPEELSEEDRLELEELERLKEKWEYDDFEDDYDRRYMD